MKLSTSRNRISGLLIYYQELVERKLESMELKESKENEYLKVIGEEVHNVDRKIVCRETSKECLESADDLDFCGPISGYMYFMMIDAYSKWIDIKEMCDICFM